MIQNLITVIGNWRISGLIGSVISFILAPTNNQKMNHGSWKAKWTSHNWLLGLLLLAATFIAYQPVWHFGSAKGEGIDADLYSWRGLCHIWTQQGEQTPESQHLGLGKGYYPLTYTTYWVEYHLWGPNPLGYYLDNVLLHALNAVVLWLLLRRLKIPGAWLGAALWVLHPVNVESVAWIPERKNTLSGLFFLCSLLAALKYWFPAEAKGRCSRNGPLAKIEGGEFHPEIKSADPAEARHGPVYFYWAALALYVLALLSKTTTIPMPVVILLLVWWKQDRVLWRDVRPLLIFFVMGIAMGLDTMHVEHNFSKWIGDFRTVFTLPLVDRLLVAGRNVWFYLGKLLWPHPLIFNYPRWKIDPLSAMGWLQFLAVPALLLFLWLKRRSWGRPVLVALLYFLVLLAPVLGFLNAMFFRRSYVADHYLYLACVGPLTLVAAGIVKLSGRLDRTGRVLKPALSAGLLLALGTLTWNQSRIYSDSETLYRTTLALNPNAWLIHTELAALLGQKGDVDAAIEQFRLALQIQPDAKTFCRLAEALLGKRQPDEAIVYFNKAIELDPDMAIAYDGLGRAYMAKRQLDDASQNFQKALQIQPDMPLSWYNLGNVCAETGKFDMAVACFQKAVGLQDDFAPAHNNLANIFEMEGRAGEAIAQWRAALKSNPNLTSAQVNLAWVLATCPQDSLRDGAAAVELAESANQLSAGNNPRVLATLAAAYAENGQFSYAVATAKQALQIASLRNNAQLANTLQQQLKFYQRNQPFRDTSMPGH